MNELQRPEWQLPEGVSRGTWEYTHSEEVAEDYDQFFAHNRLFEFDRQILMDQFELAPDRSSIVADLGCGTGRALIPLARRGFRGLAIDLSQRMLNIVAEKSQCESLDVFCVRSNLVDLRAIADDTVDHAISLFSTLGMIQGQSNRQQALEHVRRIVKPGGTFIIHVHNYWYNLYDPGGPWWLLRNYLQSLWDSELERGDKFFPYRGVSNMYLHVFTRSELSTALTRSGFTDQTFISLDRRRMQALRLPWLFGRLRANGWIVICR